MVDLKKFRIDNHISQSEICDILNVKQPYVSSIENGKRPLNEDKFNLLYNHYGNIILEYKTSDRPIIINENNDAPQISYTKGVPYYNVDFIGGFDIVLNDQTTNPEYLIDFRKYNEATCWCNVTGHSMEPEITHGDMIALKRIDDISFLPLGEVYAIVTTNGMRTIKRIGPASNTDCYSLVPTNKSPEYGVQELPKDKIRFVYQVLGCMKRL